MARRYGEAIVSTHPPTLQCRTLFLSDIHLGTRACQAELLLDFLRNVEAEEIYLVGDIVDFWKVRRGANWPQTHNDVIQKLLRKSRKGARIVFVPGNHDDVLRDYCGSHFGGIEVVREATHVAADGRRYLVLHGDEFDLVVRNARWLAWLGDLGYEAALWCNAPLNHVRRWFGFEFWSLSAFLKARVKQAVMFVGAFEEAVAVEARRRDVDGVICGHIHTAADRQFGDLRYLNTGDWVESCTAVAEMPNGEMRVIHWQQERVLQQVKPEPARQLEAA
jgi:UDP-2,3-diacylglucosamine pyrophosphatase LpxH